MKRPSFTKIRFFLIAMGALLFVSTTQNKALARDYDTDTASSAVFASGFHDGGRLVIRRIPGLGRTVIVTLKIDGLPAKGIAYGQTYDAFLRPGRHVLSVVAAPFPRFHNPWQTVLNVHVGRTYYFTAKNGSSQVVLIQASR
jgi:hypothetical protein